MPRNRQSTSIVQQLVTALMTMSITDAQQFLDVAHSIVAHRVATSQTNVSPMPVGTAPTPAPTPHRRARAGTAAAAAGAPTPAAVAGAAADAAPIKRRPGRPPKQAAQAVVAAPQPTRRRAGGAGPAFPHVPSAVEQAQQTTSPGVDTPLPLPAPSDLPSQDVDPDYADA